MICKIYKLIFINKYIIDSTKIIIFVIFLIKWNKWGLPLSKIYTTSKKSYKSMLNYNVINKNMFNFVVINYV